VIPAAAGRTQKQLEALAREAFDYAAALPPKVNTARRKAIKRISKRVTNGKHTTAA
jgi:hypothetical protein